MLAKEETCRADERKTPSRWSNNVISYGNLCMSAQWKFNQETAEVAPAASFLPLALLHKRLVSSVDARFPLVYSLSLYLATGPCLVFRLVFYFRNFSSLVVPSFFLCPPFFFTMTRLILLHPCWLPSLNRISLLARLHRWDQLQRERKEKSKSKKETTNKKEPLWMGWRLFVWTGYINIRSGLSFGSV